MFFEREAWISATVLGAAMLLCSEIGRRFGARSRLTHPERRGHHTRVEDAIFSILGLLLAFSFSAAAARFQLREQQVVHEATAIGDFTGAAGALAEPMRAELSGLARDYTQKRLEFARLKLDDPAQLEISRTTRELQSRLSEATYQAIRSGNTPSIHVALINALNGLVTAYEERLAGLRHHLPAPILLMITTFAILSALMLGRLNGLESRPDWLPRIVFAALISLVVWVMLDLEQPRRGWVTVSETAMQELIVPATP